MIIARRSPNGSGVMTIVSEEETSPDSNGECFSTNADDGACFSVSSSSSECFYINNEGTQEEYPPRPEAPIEIPGVIEIYDMHSQSVSDLYVACKYKPDDQQPEFYALLWIDFILADSGIYDIREIYDYAVISEQPIRVFSYDNFTIGDICVVVGSDIQVYSQATLTLRSTIPLSAVQGDFFLDKEHLHGGARLVEDVTCVGDTYKLRGVDMNGNSVDIDDYFQQKGREYQEDGSFRVLLSQTLQIRNDMPGKMILNGTGSTDNSTPLGGEIHATFLSDPYLECDSGYVYRIPFPEAYGYGRTLVDMGTGKIKKILYDGKYIGYMTSTSEVSEDFLNFNVSLISLGNAQASIATLSTPDQPDRRVPANECRTIHRGAMIYIEDTNKIGQSDIVI